MSDEVMDYLISIDKRNEIVNEEDKNIALRDHETMIICHSE